MSEALIGVAGFFAGICVTLFGYVLPFSNKLTGLCKQIESTERSNAQAFKLISDALNTHINSPPRECLVHGDTIKLLNDLDKRVAVHEQRLRQNG